MSVAGEMFIKMASIGDAKRDKGLITPNDITRYDNIVYGENEKWQRLDVYKPTKDLEKKLPVIVSIHGGGWVYGNKEVYQFYCMNLAQRGFVVVNFTYRLAPEFKFPAPIEDTNQVLHWVFEHAKEYGFDTNHIFAVGDSAGGHTLALYSCICTNKAYAKSFAIKQPKDFTFKAIALNCGKYHVYTDQRGDELTKELMTDYLPQKGTPEEIERICVENHITDKFPPTFLMTSNDDSLKCQAPILQEKLMEHDVPFEMHFYGDRSHRLGHVFHCDVQSEFAKKCNDDECHFFQKFLK